MTNWRCFNPECGQPVSEPLRTCEHCGWMVAEGVIYTSMVFEVDGQTVEIPVQPGGRFVVCWDKNGVATFELSDGGRLKEEQ